MGVVYYGNYATYYEIGRVECIRSLGFSYRSLEEEGIIMPVTENWSKFIRPATYDDMLVVTTQIKAYNGTRIRFEYEIHNQDNVLLNIGYTKLAFLDAKTYRPVKIPDSLDSKIAGYFEETEKK
jgi:acyl-CoA thioester hydrolase